MKIDIHTHILPPEWPNLREKFGYGGFVSLERVDECSARMVVDGKHFRTVGDNTWHPLRRIEDCEKAGVSVQVLSTVPVMFSYWAKPGDTLELSRMLNDHIAGVVAKYPKRFVGLGTLPMQDPMLACRELDRCVNQLGMAGIEIGSNINEWNLDEPILLPIFERAAELDAAVFVHPWDILGKDRLARYWMQWLVGMPAETATAVCSMIFGGVFDKLPNLRVCFAHGGGSFPGTFGRIAHGFDVRPDLCAVNTKSHPRSFLGKFFVDSLVHDPRMLKILVEMVGANRVTLGSDYPFPLGEDRPGELIESIQEMSAETKEQLLWRSAIEFLGTRFRHLAPDSQGK